MSNLPALYANMARSYSENGYAIVPVYTIEQSVLIEQFAREWVMGLLDQHAGRAINLPLETYHAWWKSVPINHGELFRASARFRYPEGVVKAALLAPPVWEFLSRIPPGGYELYRDEGLGWLGFRFIRPGMEDGYPPSCKEWGQAKGVVSVWVPVVGRSSSETLAVLPGSHVKEYERRLPAKTKFTRSEYRLAAPIPPEDFVRPNLKSGEVIFYHPRLIHTEDVVSSAVTRLNLEFRFKPLARVPDSGRSVP